MDAMGRHGLASRTTVTRRTGDRSIVIASTVAGVRGAGDELSIGERVAFYRRRRGLTQSVLAGLVGRSEDWLSKIERGQRPVRRLDVIADLARALRVTIGDLLGQPVLVEDERREGQDVPAVRDALMTPRRLSRVLFGREEPLNADPRRVGRLTEIAWTDYQRGRLGYAISALPSLIGSAQQLEDGADESADGRAAWAVSARIHHLGATTLAKVGESDLAWMAAERAMHAADQADDPMVLASASRAGTHALLAIGRYGDAMNLGITAADWLGGHIASEDPAALSLAGMLYLRTAVAAARHQDRSATADLLRRAQSIADLQGEDANHWQTAFGPTNVELHKVSTALDLGDASFVVSHGSRIPTDHMPVERGVAYRIDIARAMCMVARDDDALAALLDAERKAPQLVQHSASVRETVRTLHRRSPATGTTNSHLLALAERCRAVA